MSILSEANRILRRVTNPAPTLANVDVERRGKTADLPVPNPAAIKAPHDQATIPELEGLLADLHTERGRALNVINSQEERRAELLMEEGTDDAILALGREADIARLNVERIEVLESEARYQLGLRKAEHAKLTWNTMRDAYCREARVFYEAMCQMEGRAAHVAGHRKILCQSFGGAEEAVPRLPFFAVWHAAMGPAAAGIMPYAAAQFDASMESFSRVMFDPPASSGGRPARYRSQQDAIDAVIRGEVEPPNDETWGAASAYDPAAEVLIGFKQRRRLETGQTVEPGQKLRVPAHQARELIIARMAFLVTSTPKPGEGVNAQVVLQTGMAKGAE